MHTNVWGLQALVSRKPIRRSPRRSPWKSRRNPGSVSTRSGSVEVILIFQHGRQRWMRGCWLLWEQPAIKVLKSYTLTAPVTGKSCGNESRVMSVTDTSATKTVKSELLCLLKQLMTRISLGTCRTSPKRKMPVTTIMRPLPHNPSK